MQKSVTKKKIVKILTAFRIDPHVKELASVAAQQENRSFSNYLENLIRKDVEQRNL